MVIVIGAAVVANDVRRCIPFLMTAWASGCAASVNASASGADAAVAADVARVDATSPVDAAPSTPEAMVAGRWRAVRYRSVVSGQPVEFSDNTPFDRDFAMRVNGVLIVDGDHLRLNVGVFVERGPIAFSAGTREVPWLHQLRATTGRWRTVTGGLAFVDARQPGAEPLSFSFDDGLLWMTVVDRGRLPEPFSVGFARDPDPVRRDRLSLSVSLTWAAAGEIPATFSPALFWDVPGTARPEQPLPASPWTGSAPRRARDVLIELAGAPDAMLQGRVNNIAVAVAYPSAYADNQRDNRLGPGDGPQVSPPVAIVWRGDGPAEALRGTAFEGVLPGYSLALPQWIQGDLEPAAIGLVPFDNTLPPPFSMSAEDPVNPAYRLADFVR